MKYFLALHSHEVVVLVLGLFLANYRVDGFFGKSMLQCYYNNIWNTIACGKRLLLFQSSLVPQEFILTKIVFSILNDRLSHLDLSYKPGKHVLQLCHILFQLKILRILFHLFPVLHQPEGVVQIIFHHSNFKYMVRQLRIQRIPFPIQNQEVPELMCRSGVYKIRWIWNQVKKVK